jgi:formyltetrahydrofolate synthetase
MNAVARSSKLGASMDEGASADALQPAASRVAMISRMMPLNDRSIFCIAISINKETQSSRRECGFSKRRSILYNHALHRIGFPVIE